ATQITGSARAGVVDVLYTERAALLADFGGKIDLVVRRANAGAELHDHVRRAGGEAFSHLPDRRCDNAKLGAFAPGVHKPNGRYFWIDDVNSATVSDVNTQSDAAFIGDNTIAPGEFAAINSAGDSGRYSAINGSDFISMDLLRGEQRPTAKAACL